MPRLFAALEPPEAVIAALESLEMDVAGARWEDPAQLHLTLRFFGDIPEDTARRLVDRLSGVNEPPFALTLRGVGHFPPRGTPRSLWAGVEPCPSLVRLRNAVEEAAAALGLGPDRRKFAPHVTLARLHYPDEAAVAAFLGANHAWRGPSWSVDGYALIQSHLKPTGARYHRRARYRLSTT